MKERKYPIGIRSFGELVRGGYAYADKTGYVHELSRRYKYVLLRRPPLFGKSLLASTFCEFFSGSRDLFRNLKAGKLESEWNSYPVIHLEMRECEAASEQELCEKLNLMLARCEKKFGLACATEIPSSRLLGLIKSLSQKSGSKVVVIIDDFDAPIFYSTEAGVRAQIAGFMRDFYAPLRICDAQIRFAFAAGNSPLEGFCDISMDAEFSGICGISPAELVAHFYGDVSGLSLRLGSSYDETLERLAKKYLGYRFCEDSERLYNPFSLLNAFAKGRIGSWCCGRVESKPLIDVARNSGLCLADLDGLCASAKEFCGADPYAAAARLYQGGILTIRGYDPRFQTYSLGFPNEEILYGFLDSLVPTIFAQKQGNLWLAPFVRALEDGSISAFMAHFEFVLATVFSLPTMPAALYLIFTLLGQFCSAGARSFKDRLECQLATPQQAFMFEFRFGGTPEEARAQVDAKTYCCQIEISGRQITKVGVSFDAISFVYMGWRE